MLLDFLAALDFVDLDILLPLSPVFFFNIHGTALSWFKSYLAKRKQIATVNGKHSGPDNLGDGTIQSCILGPAFFIYRVYTASIQRHKYTTSQINLFQSKLFPPSNEMTPISSAANFWMMSKKLKSCFLLAPKSASNFSSLYSVES